MRLPLPVNGGHHCFISPCICHLYFVAKIHNFCDKILQKKTLFVRFNPTTYFQRTEKRGLLHHLAVVVVPLPEVVTAAPPLH